MLEHLHQVAVHAFYAGYPAVGREACERLLSQDLPPAREEVVRRNRTWYTQPIGALAPRFVSRRLSPDCVAPGWSAFNPTIDASRGRIFALVRSSNYKIVDGRYEMPAEDGGVIKTQNIFCELDTASLDIFTAATISEPEYDKSGFPVDGLEDVRINRAPAIHGPWRISATVRNVAGLDGNARIATAVLDASCWAPVLRDFSVLPEPIAGRHEKNWMPIAGLSEWVYAAWEEGRVAIVREVNGRWQIEPRGPSPRIARGFRGGSQLVQLDDGSRLCVIHEVAHDAGLRIYEHRFVRFDAEVSTILGVSPPFFFTEHRAIEFCCGLARHHDDFLLTWGVRDAEAWVGRAPVSDVLATVRPGWSD